MPSPSFSRSARAARRHAGRRRARALRGAEPRPHAGDAPHALGRAARARADRVRGRDAGGRGDAAETARGFVRDSGVSTRPGAWITRAGNAAVAAVAARGEAMTTEITRDVPLLAKKLRFGSGRWEVEQSARARAPPDGDGGRLVRGRPRGTWISPQFRWVTTEDWLGAPIDDVDPGAARAALLGRWLAAFGPASETDMRRWAGWTARETRAALAATPHAEVDLGGPTGYVPRTTSSRRARRPRRRRSSRRSIRRRWAGRSASGTSARTERRSSTRTATPGRPSGGRGGSSAAGASAGTARSRSGCSRTSAATRVRRSTPRRSASPTGSETPLLARLPAAVPAAARQLGRCPARPRFRGLRAWTASADPGACDG